MDLEETQRHWERLAQSDPLYAVLSEPSKRGRRWQEAEFFATGEAEIAELARRAGALGLSLGGRRALDFGCGVGRLTQALAGLYAEALGVDASPSMLELARAYDRRGRCRFALNQAPDLAAFPGGHFDLVYSNLVLQHLPPAAARRFIAEFLRLRSPGGLAVFHLPTRGEGSRLRAALKALCPPPLLRAWRRLRYGAGHPAEVEVAMHGVPEAEVLELLRSLGGEVLLARGGWYWVGDPPAKKV